MRVSAGDDETSVHNQDSHGASDLDIKNAQTETQEKVTPLPRLKVFVAGVLIFSDAFNGTSLFPYIGFLVKDFTHIVDDKIVGYYAGLLGSSFFLAQFLCSFFWGWVSDKWGRRPVLLFGLLGTLISTISFGFSTSFTWAIITRFMSGLLNGNNPVVKTYLGEITDKTNQARAFSVIGLVWGLGTIVGPLMGGLLATAPDVDGNFNSNGPFGIFHYMLPNLVSASVTLVGLIFGYFYLTVSKRFTYSGSEDLIDDLPNQNRSRGFFNWWNRNKYTTLPSDNEATVEMSETSTEPHNDKAATTQDVILFDVGTPNNGNKADQSRGDTSNAALTEVPNSSDNNLASMLKDMAMLCSCIIYGIIGLVFIMFDEAFPLWSMNNPKDGGLGFKSSQIGLIASISGTFIVFFQLVIAPWVAQKVGLLRMLRYGAAMAIPVMLLIPAVNLLADTKWLMWGALIILYLGRHASSQLGFTAVMILVNNSAEERQRGRVNGFAQSLVSLTRTVGPSLSGTILAWSLNSGNPFPLNFFLDYIIMAILLLVILLLAAFLPESINRPKGDVKRSDHIEVLME